MSRRGWSLGLLSVLWLCAADWDDPLRGLVIESNELFAAEQFSRAQEKLEEALRQRPDSKLLHFNLGAVLFRLGDFEGALAQFQGALGDADDRFAAKVYYNIGNCQVRLQRLRLALDAFKKAVKLDPEDRDARVNLEFVATALAKGELSQRAKDAYAQALGLVEKRLYRQALEALGPVAQEEPAAAKRYASFLRRLQQVVEIVPPVPEAKI
jgi:tetratricopeptide (TPR) repeat protein